MKRLLLTACVVILGVGAVLAYGAGWIELPDDEGASSSTTTAATNPGRAAESADAIDVDVAVAVAGSDIDFPFAPATARQATVRRLADGDSFDITWTDSGESGEVRLLGINAPEGGACFGDEARTMLDTLIGNDPILVEAIESDEFGRTIANVWVGDLFVNGTLVQLGAALPISNDGQHAQVIASAQQEAEQGQVGLWSSAACGVASSELRISDIRADAPGRDDENPNGEWIEIANDGATSADMTNWSIRDESTRHRFFFPDGYQIPAGDFVVVYSGCGTDTQAELYWCDGDPVWNNGGDTGFLVDPDGNFADSYTY